MFPPDATVKLGKTINLQRDSILIGYNTKLLGSDNITILRFPRFNGVIVGTKIQGFHFSGKNCVAIGVSSEGEGDGQGYYRYVPRLTLEECHFYWEMNFGLNANFIFLKVHNCSFGYRGMDGEPQTLKGIRSHYTTSEANNSNFNIISNSYFYRGTPDTTGIDVRGGTHWIIEHCDFEVAGQCIIMDKIDLIQIRDSWFESSHGKDGIIKITNCNGSAIIDNCMLYRCGGLDGGVISYDGNTVKSLTVSNCKAELQGTAMLLNIPLKGTSAAIKVPPTNCIRFFDNIIEGTTMAGSPYVSSYNYKGEGSVRAKARFNYAAGTVTSSSVEVTLSKQAVGSYLLTFPANLGVSSITSLAISATVYDGYARFAAAGQPNQILLNTYKGDTHALFDSQDVSLIVV